MREKVHSMMQKLKGIEMFRKMLGIDTPLVRVCSHPRSGTHFLEKFLADNFYPDRELQTGPMAWGHWSNRLTDERGNPLGKLFGNHYFPEHKKNVGCALPTVYIYRDGRAVCLSIWKTFNFKHKDWKDIDFSDFLQRNIDWSGSPGKRVEKPFETIVEHWKRHVESWAAMEGSPNLLLVRYEDIVTSPEMVADTIMQRFPFLKRPECITRVDKPFGLLPNKAQIDAWKEHFSQNDLRYFHSVVPESHFALHGGLA